MKKLLLLGIACALSASAMAQTEKGSKYLGVSIGNIGYNKKDNFSSVGVTLTPSAGVFVTDDLLVGTGLQLGYQRSKFESNIEDRTNRNLSYGLSPYVRYYFAGTSPHRFFGQLSGGILWNNGYNKIESGSASSTFKNTSHSATASAGFGYNYFLTPGAALEVTANYGRFGIGNSNNSNGGLSINAGFAVFLPSKLSTTSTGQ